MADLVTPVEPTIEEDIIKGGKSRIGIALSRGPEGLVVNVRTHQQIEDWVKALGTDGVGDLALVTRKWLQRTSKTGETQRPFSVYMGGKIPPLTTVDGERISLNDFGGPLYDAGKNQINLSFLRFVGTSEGGVEFVVREVHSLESIRLISSKLTAGLRKFYQEYMRPVNISITMNVTELRN